MWGTVATSSQARRSSWLRSTAQQSVTMLLAMGRRHTGQPVGARWVPCHSPSPLGTPPLSRSRLLLTMKHLPQVLPIPFSLAWVHLPFHQSPSAHCLLSWAWRGPSASYCLPAVLYHVFSAVSPYVVCCRDYVTATCRTRLFVSVLLCPEGCPWTQLKPHKVCL